MGLRSRASVKFPDDADSVLGIHTETYCPVRYEWVAGLKSLPSFSVPRNY